MFFLEKSWTFRELFPMGKHWMKRGKTLLMRLSIWLRLIFYNMTRFQFQILLDLTLKRIWKNLYTYYCPLGIAW